uniref:CCHC-type domain-containing protein n=1 Tax=Aegilops tauschii subsp. strangulata TaxID=200361 RepID=A0A453S0Z8_AEGTS
MAGSPCSVTSSFHGERPVVSGLGLPSASDGSAAEEVGAAGVPTVGTLAAPTRRIAPWQEAPASKRTLWKRRREAGPSVGEGGPCSPPRREVTPEMRDRCFKCLEKGHFLKDCTNKVVCLRCGLSGHVASQCKRPRSPSLVEELRRDAAAKVARRSSGVGVAAALGVSRQGAAAPRAVSPSPPPLRRLETRAASPLGGHRRTEPRLEVQADLEMSLSDLCIVRRSRAMAELEGRLQHAMVVFVSDDRSGLLPELVRQALQA